MRRLLASFLISILLALPVSAFDWSGVFDRVTMSTAQIYHDGGSCTAFSINQLRKIYLTAHHCLGEDLLMFKETTPGIGMQHAWTVLRILATSAELDVAVIEADLGMPAVLRGKNPRKGEEVAALGYGLGEPEPFIIGSNVAYLKEARTRTRTRMILFRDNQDLGGMSGGPVVDTRGRVVGMVQSGLTLNGRITNIALGTAISDIYKFTKQYWSN